MTDTIKAAASYGFAFVTMAMAYYGLVLYPFELDPLVKGALIGWASAAIAFVFGQEIAKATAANAQRAYDSGVSTPTPTITTTIDPGPPATATTTATPVTEDIGNG